MNASAKTALAAAVLGAVSGAVLVGAWTLVLDGISVFLLATVLVAAAKDRIARRSCR